MEGQWKVDGRSMEGPWKADGRSMEGPWKVSGRKVHGRSMEGRWKVDGRSMEAHLGDEWVEAAAQHAAAAAQHRRLGAERVEDACETPMEGRGRSWEVMGGRGRSWEIVGDRGRSWEITGGAGCLQARRRCSPSRRPAPTWAATGARRSHSTKWRALRRGSRASSARRPPRSARDPP